jgi:hypothetical protein
MESHHQSQHHSTTHNDHDHDHEHDGIEERAEAPSQRPFTPSSSSSKASSVRTTPVKDTEKKIDVTKADDGKTDKYAEHAKLLATPPPTSPIPSSASTLGSSAPQSPVTHLDHGDVSQHTSYGTTEPHTPLNDDHLEPHTFYQDILSYGSTLKRRFTWKKRHDSTPPLSVGQLRGAESVAAHGGQQIGPKRELLLHRHLIFPKVMYKS